MKMKKVLCAVIVTMLVFNVAAMAAGTSELSLLFTENADGSFGIAPEVTMEEQGTIILAAYKEGVLIDVKMADAEAAAQITDGLTMNGISSEADTVKAFAFSSTGTLTPLQKQLTYDLNDVRGNKLASYGRDFGFERGTSLITSLGSNTNLSVIRSIEDAHNGEASMKVSVTAGKWGASRVFDTWWFPGATNASTLTVRPETKYDVSFWVKAAPGQTVGAGTLRLYNTTNLTNRGTTEITVPFPEFGDTWTKVTFPMITNAELKAGNFVEIRLGADGIGRGKTFYIDDMCISESPVVPEEHDVDINILLKANQDYGFESGTSLFTDRTAGNGVTVTRVNTDSHSGDYSYQVTVPNLGYNLNTFGAYWYSNIYNNLKPSTNYIISFWVKEASGRQVPDNALTLLGAGKMTGESNFGGFGGEWTKISIPVTTAATLATGDYFRIRLNNPMSTGTGGHVYLFDDFCVKEAPAE